MSQVPVMLKDKQLGLLDKSENADAATARTENLANAVTAFPGLFSSMMAQAVQVSVPIAFPLSPLALTFARQPPVQVIFRTLTNAISTALEADGNFSEDLLALLIPPAQDPA